MLTELAFSRTRRRATLVAAATLASALMFAPGRASAEGLFDFLFGMQNQKPTRQAPAQANPDSFGANPPAQSLPATRAAGSGPAFCVRSCDGKYFPLTMRNSSPVQTCQAFCPASPTKVFFGSNIDYATASNGERYAESDNAYAFRKALRADCTCNGRNPSGLAPVDLTLDTSLRSGDVVATADGLVAYTGVRLGAEQTAEFTPVAAFPGLTAEVRARLGEMRVAPVSAEMIATNTPIPELKRDTELTTGSIPKAATPKPAKRVEVN